MKREGVRRSEKTYTALIHAYGEQGQVARCAELIEEMKRDGVKPDEKTYIALMHAYGAQGRVAQCAELVEEMKREGVKVDERTYKSLMGAYVNKQGGTEGRKEGQKEGQKDGKKEWKERRIKTREKDKGEDAKEVLEKLQKDGIQPTSELYNTLIVTSAKRKDTKQCLELMQAMKEKGIFFFPPLLSFSNLLISHCARCRSQILAVCAVRYQ